MMNLILVVRSQTRRNHQQADGKDGDQELRLNMNMKLISHLLQKLKQRHDNCFNEKNVKICKLYFVVYACVKTSPFIS